MAAAGCPGAPMGACVLPALLQPRACCAVEPRAAAGLRGALGVSGAPVASALLRPGLSFNSGSPCPPLLLSLLQRSRSEVGAAPRAGPALPHAPSPVHAGGNCIPRHPAWSWDEPGVGSREWLRVLLRGIPKQLWESWKRRVWSDGAQSMAQPQLFPSGTNGHKLPLCPAPP